MAINIGLVGCGYWGPKLARNIDEIPEARLAIVADLDDERLEHMRGLYPDVRTTSYHVDVFESDVDAVVIATPVSTHHRLAIEALGAGKHVLVEKPLAATLEQAREIASVADARGLVAMVGHTFQHNPAVQALKQLIVSGELGDVFYLDAVRANLGLLQPDINVIWDLAPHDISILLTLLDNDPVSVSAYGRAFIRPNSGIDEVAYVTLEFPNNILANIHLSWLDPVKTRQITVVGSEKMAVYDDIAEQRVTVFDKGVDVLRHSDTVEEFEISYRHGGGKSVPVDWQEPLRVQCCAFLDSIREGTPSASDAWMGVRVVGVLEAIERAMQDTAVEVAVLV